MYSFQMVGNLLHNFPVIIMMLVENTNSNRNSKKHQKKIQAARINQLGKYQTFS